MESFPPINYVIRNLIIIVVIIIVYGVRNLTADCPNLCECKWKSGKESVVCLNANLTGIPTKLDASTQILDLTGNEVVNVPRDAFNNANLLNLQKIYIVRCRLKIIDRYAFRKLINLVELDISYNSLTMIPSHAFESISELRVLSIIGNPIQRITNEAFANVPQLTRLELSNCKISMIELRAFTGVEATLERLNLDGNKLMEIRSLTFTLLRNLHSLELAGNPWNCSCNIRPLREWMLKENIPYDIPPTCKFPQRLAGKLWDKIELDEFACVPHILAPDIKAHGVEGKNVTMSCMVGGVPEPNVRWTVKNRIIANISGNTMMPTAQGRKMYMVNLQENASNLTILTAEVQDAGIYTCTAENKAGRVEASVTLAVSRKPPEAPLSTRVLIASIIVASLFIIALSLAVICICTLQKRKKIRRWHTHHGGRRTDSYEKIELNHKPHSQTLHLGYKGGSPKPDGNCFLKPYGENGISVVGHVRRNGDYRNVPSEDDGTGYEDNIESSNAMLSSGNATARRDNLHTWKGASNRNGSPPSTTTITSAITTTDQWKSSNDNNNIMDRPRIEDSDLHIPRLIEFSDATPDSESNSLSKHCESANINSSTAMGSSLIADCINGNNTNYKITNNNWSSQLVMMKNAGKNNNNDIIYSTDNDVYTLKNIAGEQENNFDIDRKYPDLLDISSFNNTMGNNNNNNNNNINNTNTNNNNSGITISNILNNNNNNNNNNINSVTNASNTICTLPRKKNGNGRFFKNVSDSQSPLLPECLSRYGSSNNFTENNYINDSFTSRRFSIDSYSNYPSSLSTKISSSSNNAINITDKINHHTAAAVACSGGAAYSGNDIRASSFLNLTMSSPKSIGKNHKRNPSLPTTPTREKSTQHTIFSPAATPLLDFSSFTMRNPMVLQSSNSPSSTVNAYDYHAAQLERFLEEYRNLQEQLCKMKQTCDSIRKKEHPVRNNNNNNNNNNNTNNQSNLKLNDSIMYSSVASGGAGGLFITTNDNNNNNTTTTITTTTLNNTIDNNNSTSTSSSSSKNNNNTTFPRNPAARNKALLPGQTPEPPPYWLHRNVMFKKLQEQTDTDFYHQS